MACQPWRGSITASYRHRYKTLDPDQDQDLIASLGAYSLKACLAASGD